MLIIIDNYDSFTFNLYQYLGELGATMQVYRNDKITVDEMAARKPKGIVISPGPGRPEDGGISLDVVARFTGHLPILGVCLGHQCVAQHFGGVIRRADRIMHGKTSLIKHNQEEIFVGLDNPFVATRYHSLLVDRDTLPDCLEIIAETDEGEIMGVRHLEHPSFGVQFHPESILTTEGKKVLDNFLRML